MLDETVSGVLDYMRRGSSRPVTGPSPTPARSFLGNEAPALGVEEVEGKEYYYDSYSTDPSRERRMAAGRRPRRLPATPTQPSTLNLGSLTTTTTTTLAAAHTKPVDDLSLAPAHLNLPHVSPSPSHRRTGARLPDLPVRGRRQLPRQPRRASILTSKDNEESNVSVLVQPGFQSAIRRELPRLGGGRGLTSSYVVRTNVGPNVGNTGRDDESDDEDWC